MIGRIRAGSWVVAVRCTGGRCWPRIGRVISVSEADVKSDRLYTVRFEDGSEIDYYRERLRLLRWMDVWLADPL